MARIVVALVALLALALPLPASAAWGWTSWGMSAKDVINGSGGRVQIARAEEDQRVNDWWMLAAGPVSDDGFAFDGQFYFDKRGKQLHLVRLTLQKPDDCGRLTARLTELHGAPVDASAVVTVSGRSVKITALRWNDDGAGNFLALTSLPGVGQIMPLCFIRYRPVTEPDAAS